MTDENESSHFRSLYKAHTLISAGQMSRSCNSPTAIFILLDIARLGVITGSKGYLFETSD